MSRLDPVAIEDPPRSGAAPRRIDGSRLLLVTSVILLALASHALLATDSAEQGARLLIRQTARLSLLAFCAAFAASSALRLWPHPATRWLMRNRRWLGLCFALSHLVHLVAILALLEIARDFEIEPLTIVFGGLAYVFIAALAATSFDGAVARLGKHRWQRLHKTGMYYIWAIFALSYLPRAAASAAYVPAAALLIVVFALRIAAHRRPTRGLRIRQ